MSRSLKILLSSGIVLLTVGASPQVVSQECRDYSATENGDEILEVEDRIVIVAGPQERTVTFTRLCEAVMIVTVCVDNSFTADMGKLAEKCVSEGAEKLSLEGNLEALKKKAELVNAIHECRVKPGYNPFAGEALRYMQISLRLEPDPDSCGPWCGSP